jgi:hypothetical protein
MSAPTAPKINCEHCNKTFSRQYCLNRHVIRKHIIDDDNVITKNTGNLTNNTGNITNFTGNITNFTGNITKNTGNNITDNIDISTGTDRKENQCVMCMKTFSRNWYLMKHIDKCTGPKSCFQCEYCSKEFSHKDSRFKHYKICKTKKEIDSKALVPVTTEQELQASTINNTTNIQTQNIENQNNIQNQQNVQQQNNVIILYNSGNPDFKTDHLKAEDIQKILQLANPFVDSRLVTEYSKKILSHPENQCIKKEDLKSGHSEIHMGDDQWELELDRNIYPKLACNMANNMSEFLYTQRDKVKREVFDKITRFIDYMADNGYINTDDIEKQKEIKKEYKTFEKGLKLVVYGLTSKKLRKKK